MAGAAGIFRPAKGTEKRATRTNRSAIFASAKYLPLSLLVIFIVWIGLQPRFFLDRMSPTLKNLNAGVIAQKRGGRRRSGSDSEVRI